MHSLQVQLPQFRKAGLEVTAIFSRGQQRARQVAEQARMFTMMLIEVADLQPESERTKHRISKYDLMCYTFWLAERHQVLVL